MGKTIQAISLIVTHRSDDMAQHSRSESAAPVQRPQQQAAQRPKLRLGAALPKPAAQQQQHGHDHSGGCCGLQPEAEALAGALPQLLLAPHKFTSCTCIVLQIISCTGVSDLCRWSVWLYADAAPNFGNAQSPPPAPPVAWAASRRSRRLPAAPWPPPTRWACAQPRRTCHRTLPQMQVSQDVRNCPVVVSLLRIKPYSLCQ